MKTQLKIAAALTAGIMVVTAGAIVHGQDMRRENSRRIVERIQSIDTSKLTQIMRSMDKSTMIQGIQSMDQSTLEMIFRNVDPSKLAVIAKHLAGEMTRPHANLQTAFSRDGAVQRGVTKDSTDAETQSNIKEQPDLSNLTVMVHPSNPVSRLDPAQIQKLFNGEYVNWNQVGGPDLKVKIIITSNTFAGAETFISNSLRTKITQNAVKVAFQSAVIPLVSRDEGAISAIPTGQDRQAKFLGTHKAIKLLAVSDQSDEDQTETVANGKAGSSPLQKISLSEPARLSMNLR